MVALAVKLADTGPSRGLVAKCALTVRHSRMHSGWRGLQSQGLALVPACGLKGRPGCEAGRAAQGDLPVVACMEQCQPELLSPGLGFS